jgi:hypothetical protein
MSHGRIYTITISGIASPAAVFDFVEISPAANKPVRIRRIRIAQTSEPTTEEEQLAITVIRGHTTSGSGGDTTPDGGPLNPSDTAAGYTAETMNTTIASAGTAVNLVEDAWNSRAGYDMAFAPEEAPEGFNGSLLVIRSSAPADAITIRGTIWVEEIA